MKKDLAGKILKYVQINLKATAWHQVLTYWALSSTIPGVDSGYSR